MKWTPSGPEIRTESSGSKKTVFAKRGETFSRSCYRTVRDGAIKSRTPASIRPVIVSADGARSCFSQGAVCPFAFAQPMKMSSWSLNERNVISDVASSPAQQTYDKERSFYRSVGNRAARNISATKIPRGAITAFLFSSAFSPRCTWSDTYPALVVYLRFFLPDSLVKTLASIFPACDLKIVIT